MKLKYTPAKCEINMDMKPQKYQKGHHLLCTRSSLGRLYANSCYEESFWLTHIYCFDGVPPFSTLLSDLHVLAPTFPPWNSHFQPSAREEAQFRVGLSGQ